MQKSEKSLEPFLRKLRYQPTNQPIITNNTNLIGPWLRRSKKAGPKMDLCGTPIFAVL